MLIHTATYYDDEFPLAGDAHARQGYVEVAFDIEMYDDGDWDIARVGFGTHHNPKRIWWLDEASEAPLSAAIRQRALNIRTADIEEFVRLEMREVA